MTVRYEGSDYYTIHIGNREFILHTSEIHEIQSYDFERGLEGLTTIELNDKIEDLEDKLDELNDTIEGLEQDLEDGKDELEDALSELKQVRKELEQYD